MNIVDGELQALIETCRALSQEIVLDRLIDQLIVATVEHAGASGGVILLSRQGEMHVMAQAGLCDDAV